MPEVVAQGPAVTNSDGASCPFTLGLDKTVDPASACAGTTVTYRYEVTNEAIDPTPGEGGTVTSADFVDDLPDDGRAFVTGSLVNPFGGEVNAYGRTDRLQIDELQITSGQSGVIEVDVALPADLAPGTLMNQARLSDISGNLGAEVLSEFSGTPQLPDPTPLQVRSCADLGVDKTAQTPVAGPGDQVVYTIRVTNHGPSDAVGVDSLADTLPDGLTPGTEVEVSADGTIRWPAFDLAAGAHRDVTVSATADEDVRQAAGDDGDLDNTASVQHPGDPNPANDQDTAVVPVDHPDLVVDKDDGLTTVDPGDEVTYTIRVTQRRCG